MTRILIIDDIEKPEFIEQLSDEVSQVTGQPVETRHLNPTLSFKGGDTTEEMKVFLNGVRQTAAEFWDVVLVDVNLNDVKIGTRDKLHLALSIASHVRETNRSALLILYSGTLSNHVQELLNTKESAEKELKRIYRTDIAAFASRKGISLQVIESLSAPPFVLTVERALVENPGFVVTGLGDEYKGRTLGDLAASIRRQDALGVRLVGLVAQHGIAAIIELS